MLLTLEQPVDNLCDYTYRFSWQNNALNPDGIIPHQKGTNHTFRELVEELKKGKEVRISGDVGRRLAYSAGVDLRHFGGTGAPERAGKIFIDGSVAAEMGMGMVSGVIYVRGGIEEPIGNVVEVLSDEPDYRKFRSITEILCRGPGKDELVGNSFDRKKKHLILKDGMLRGTVAARCTCDALVTVEGNVYNGAGLLMQKGTVHVKGNAGMNAGAHLDGGTLVVEGTAGEFAGAYMKKGVLILREARGFVGANLKDGVIYSRKKVKVSPPLGELAMSQQDGKILIRHLGIGHVEAMSYHKYGILKEKLVRMRDGSVVVRRME
jgi:formylmethanofuran dehydrogenase subunit C